MSESRRIGRCEKCGRDVYDADEFTRVDDLLYCPWCDPDETPLEDPDDRG